MAKKNYYSNIGFEDFRRLASREDLSKYERIGFPNEFRFGFEGLIFDDILKKLSNLDNTDKMILDIGPGCSDLPLMLIERCRTSGHTLHLVDSGEMLNLLPEENFIVKTPALFPNCPNLVEKFNEKFDVILCYSVLQYVFIDTSLFRFLDVALSLLAPGGQFLIGDIPNVSKRKRFLGSEAGIQFHKAFMKTKRKPNVNFNTIEHDQIDDAVVFSLVQRARAQGFHAYVLPQSSDLPMSNRREDVLIIRP